LLIALEIRVIGTIDVTPHCLGDHHHRIAGYGFLPELDVLMCHRSTKNPAVAAKAAAAVVFLFKMETANGWLRQLIGQEIGRVAAPPASAGLR